MGNYNNGIGRNGGAFGFKLASLNRIVDTKAASGGTYLHFLQRTIQEAEPDLEGFVDEITQPAETYRRKWLFVPMISVQMGITGD